MFGNFILFAQPLLYLILLQWTFKLLTAACLYAYCGRMNELPSALSCWDLLVSIQGCNRFALVRACTGMEGAASSKFGHAKANDKLNRLKDTILTPLYVKIILTLWLRKEATLHTLKLKTV